MPSTSNMGCHPSWMYARQNVTHYTCVQCAWAKDKSKSSTTLATPANASEWPKIYGHSLSFKWCIYCFIIWTRFHAVAYTRVVFGIGKCGDVFVIQDCLCLYLSHKIHKYCFERLLPMACVHYEHDVHILCRMSENRIEIFSNDSCRPMRGKISWIFIFFKTKEIAEQNFACTYQLFTCNIVNPVSCANCFFWSSEGYGCCK